MDCRGESRGFRVSQRVGLLVWLKKFPMDSELSRRTPRVLKESEKGTV